MHALHDAPVGVRVKLCTQMPDLLSLISSSFKNAHEVRTSRGRNPTEKKNCKEHLMRHLSELLRVVNQCAGYPQGEEVLVLSCYGGALKPVFAVSYALHPPILEANKREEFSCAEIIDEFIDKHRALFALPKRR